MAEKNHEINFDTLALSINRIHNHLQAEAGRAINLSLTIRNWMIGFYIREYEQEGGDRANYGDALLEKLADRLRYDGMKRSSARELRRYRKFYMIYPQIWDSATPEIHRLLPGKSLHLPIRESVTPESALSGGKLITNLSFTHLAELITIDDPVIRGFYEEHCIRGNWSVRELKRQISSLYFERSGLSTNKAKLVQQTDREAEQKLPMLAIRDPYIFEFLGLKAKEVMSESDLEDGLLDKLQDFLLELGHGFCFEARQKRILIGDAYGFIDLVFYHRILKCHVLIDLKVEQFSHENIGQLNTYVSWYRKNMMTDNDNPPIGILLCTRKDHALVEYALAGMDNNLFVSKYQLELPSRDEMKKLLEDNMPEITGR